MLFYHTFRKSDYLIRWGGDEFTGIIAGTLDEATASLEEMSKRVSSVRVDDLFYMTISTGVVEIASTAESQDIDGLVMLADKALYKAKESGRNKVCTDW